MKNKSPAYVLGFFISVLLSIYLYKNFAAPKIAAVTICKAEENCIKGLEIGVNGALELVYSEDGRYLYGIGLDGAKRWDIEARYKPNKLMGGHATGLALSENSQFAIGTDRQEIRVFDSDAKDLLEISTESEDVIARSGMLLSEKYNLVALPVSGEERGKPYLSFWSSKNGNFVTKLPHNSAISKVAISKNDVIAVGQYDGKLVLWPVANLEEYKVLEASTAGVSSLAFSKSGDTLAAGDSLGNVKLWDVETGRQKGGFKVAERLITGLALSADGSSLFASFALENGSGKLVVWDLNTNKEVSSWKYNREINQIALSPDQSQLAISLRKKHVTVVQRVKNTKSYGPKWVDKESSRTDPAVILIRDISSLDLAKDDS